MNATDAIKQAEQNERDARANMLLERMLEDFAKDFMPLNQLQSLRFHTGLTTIVRQATMDAHRVYGDQLTKHTSALMMLHQPPVIIRGDTLEFSDADLRPGGIVYKPPFAMKPLDWAESAWETGHGDERKAVEWRATQLGLVYTVVEHARTFAVALDGRRFTNRATLELAKAAAYDDCAAHVKAVLA